MYDEFGNYIGPDLNLNKSDDDHSDQDHSGDEDHQNHWMNDLKDLKKQSKKDDSE